MAENRLARELDTRETTQRVKQWQSPTLLPTPEPEEGYSFRWIRTSLLGQADPTNVSAKFREGWEPVKSESQPKMFAYSDPNSRFKAISKLVGFCCARFLKSLWNNAQRSIRKHPLIS